MNEDESVAEGDFITAPGPPGQMPAAAVRSNRDVAFTAVVNRLAHSMYAEPGQKVINVTPEQLELPKKLAVDLLSMELTDPSFLATLAGAHAEMAHKLAERSERADAERRRRRGKKK